MATNLICSKKHQNLGKQSSQWSNLQPELLDLIIMRLSDPEDFIQFQRVCSSWCSAATERRRLSHPPPLLIAYDCCNVHNSSAGLCNTGGRFRQLSNREFGIRNPIYSVTMGWLLEFKDMTESSLLNPLSGEQIVLPSLLRCKSANVMMKWGIRYVAMSSPPTSSDCVVVVAAPSFSTLSTVVALCRPWRDKEWTILYNDKYFENDYVRMAFHKGSLYIINESMITMVFNLDLPSKGLQQPVQLIALESTNIHARYSLVESDGELFLVYVDEANVYGRGRPPATRCWVFKLEGDKWVRIWNLGDRTLLLTSFSAESISSKDLFTASFERNCIYYYYERDMHMHKYSMKDWHDRKIHLPILCPQTTQGYWVKPRL